RFPGRGQRAESRDRAPPGAAGRNRAGKKESPGRANSPNCAVVANKLMAPVRTTKRLQLVTKISSSHLGVVLGCVSSGQLSVRNGEAGRPALLHRFNFGKFDQPKRTATGLSTFWLLTVTVSGPVISASASTNF